MTTKPKILLVDDDKNILKLLQFILKDEYEVIDVKDPQKALHFIEHLDLDCVVADIDMPVMDGFEFLSAVRNLYKEIELPVIMLSGKENSADKVKSFKLGADDYMTKPFNPDELKARINHSIRLRKEVIQRVTTMV